jgi:transposase-like protein
MPRQSETGRLTRRRYSDEFKSEALALADSVGVSEAAAQLQLQTSQRYAYCSRRSEFGDEGKLSKSWLRRMPG